VADLSPKLRRVLGHPVIPMSAQEIAQRIHPFVDMTPEEVDELLRGEFTDNGWIVKLGAHDDPAKLASTAQLNKRTIPMADEQAQILERRLRHPAREWRLRGDLWMLSMDGLEALKAPTVESPPMAPMQVQAVVDSEWARVVHDFKPGETSLAGALLPDEFAYWFELVADECERVWNVRPKAPIAGGASGYTDAYEVALLNAENQKTALGTVVDPWYMTLSIVAFNDTDTGTTAADGTHVPTYTGWARKTVAGTDMGTASGTTGSVSNTSAITFAPCTAGTSTIIACANCADNTTGAMRKWGDVASTVISTTQTPATFAIGAYVTSTA